MFLQWTFLLLLTPLLATQEQEETDTDTSGEPQETGECKAPSDWDPKLQFTPNHSSYALNDLVHLSCAGEEYLPSVPQIRCISNGTQALWNGTATCNERCRQPWWDRQLHFTPEQEFYELKEEVTLSCISKDFPPFAVIRCASKISQGLKVTWEVKDHLGTWHEVAKNLNCNVGKCPKLQQIQLLSPPNRRHYQMNEELKLTCRRDLKPSFPKIICTMEFEKMSSGTPVYRGAWWGRDSTGSWMRIEGAIECIEICQRPRWDTRLQLTPDQDKYKKNEDVMLSCPEGFQPSFTHVKCSSKVKSNNYGRRIYREVWLTSDSIGYWAPIQSRVECIEVLQVVPGTLETSSTSIQLNWTCRLPDACQHMQAMCRLAEPSSPPCEAEEVKGQEMLHGQEGTFTCPHLQPFTNYNITISLPPSTVLFTWLVRTKETVPDKLEKLWLDPTMGLLRWKVLPSCKGEIIGYQLNVTARSARDGGLLEMERLWLGSAVTEHTLAEHGPGSSYVVTIQGLTAAGAGAASLWEFQTNSSDTPHPLGINCRSVRDISPSQGTAVLPLQPIVRPHEAARELQLIVTATHNGTAVEDACSGEPQPSDASRQPGPYVAAVLNLSAATDFVLGDGTRGPGYHNAALRPGQDYTALLRLVHRLQQAEKFTCVCYSFSVVSGHSPGPWHGTMIGVIVLLAILLVSAVILWFVLSRKWKSLPSKAKEDNQKDNGGQAGDQSLQPLPKATRDIQSSEGAEMTPAPC